MAADVPALHMLNSEWVEVWPACLVDCGGSLQDRAFDGTQWQLRDKPTGQFPLQLDIAGGLRRNVPDAVLPEDVFERMQRAATDVVDALANDADLNAWNGNVEVATSGTQHILEAFGIDIDAYSARTGLPFTVEPSLLRFAGFDRYARSLWLTKDTAHAWNAMQDAAAADGITLEAISGFRSHQYQLGIFRRKLERGQTIAEILNVNAAPGFSEHHSGTALDIGTPGEPPAEESFENTEAYEWLRANAGSFGFRLSYPKGNPHGITYEPWHWAYVGLS